MHTNLQAPLLVSTNGRVSRTLDTISDNLIMARKWQVWARKTTNVTTATKTNNWANTVISYKHCKLTVSA